MVLGNQSRYSTTWINGPQHENRAQKVPGYTGYIPGVKAENIFASTYTNQTAKSMSGRIPRGMNEDPERKFKSITMAKHNATRNNRRLMEAPEKASYKDYLEYSMVINKDSPKEREHFVSNSPTGREKGRHIDKSYTTFSPDQWKRDLNGSPH